MGISHENQTKIAENFTTNDNAFEAENYDPEMNMTINPLEFDIIADTKLVLKPVSKDCLKKISDNEQSCFNACLSNFVDISKFTITDDTATEFEKKVSIV